MPFDLEKPDPAIETLLTTTTVRTSLSTIFTKNSSEGVEGLRWALQRGCTVDIDIQATLSDSLLEGFEDLIAKATADLPAVPPIVLCTSLGPPLSFCIMRFNFVSSEHSAAPSQP